MRIELAMLAWTVVLGLVQLVVAAQFLTAANGLGYGASPRDEPPPNKPSVLGGRFDRAAKNLLETFPFAAAAILAAVASGRVNGYTAFGAQLYFWARVAYLGLYVAGIPYARSLVWLASVAGIGLVLFGLIGG
jgi:uncharacterized MAPEG superfamily protein